MKGKINQSLAAGLAVVATRVAAEGMYIEDGESALIADGALAFAHAVGRLYGDAEPWSGLSQSGSEVMDEHFSFAAATRSATEFLATLGTR